MTESPQQRLTRWSEIHASAVMAGWNFDSLEGRLSADDPPWDFETMCLEAMRSATSVLDMGTGGGERLLELDRHLGGGMPQVSATEGWAPNMPVATSALAGIGIEVREYDSETGGPLPWPDGSFDLVMNRHESFDAAEVARVLRPSGRFLTQQVDSSEAQEFRDWFGGTTDTEANRLAGTRAGLMTDGFSIVSAQEWAGTMEFADIEAVIEYLGYVPWDVPGFSVVGSTEALERLAAAGGPFLVTQKRFVIEARLR